jgi:hypothetical protein
VTLFFHDNVLKNVEKASLASTGYEMDLNTGLEGLRLKAKIEYVFSEGFRFSPSGVSQGMICTRTSRNIFQSFGWALFSVCFFSLSLCLYKLTYILTLAPRLTSHEP